MGAKHGKFRNAEGDIIWVTFEGEGVADGELTMGAQPVILQMDGGGGEYAAVKPTTASITLLSDGLQHLDLYAASPLAVRVTVRHDQSYMGTLFNGYITPNTFSQGVDGVNDTLTIEAADVLGMAKYIPYRRVNDAEGFQMLTIQQLLTHILTLIGADDALMVDFVRATGGTTMEQKKYELLTISEDYFFDSATLPRTLPDGSRSYATQGASCYDVLEQIAAAFRGVWISAGNVIVLGDPLTAMQGTARARSLIDGSEVALTGSISLPAGGVAAIGGNIALTEESFATSGSSVSVLPRYSLFSLSNGDMSARSVLPDFFDNSLLSVVYAPTADETAISAVETQYDLTQVLSSRIATLEPAAMASQSLPSATFIAHKSVKVLRRSYTDYLKTSDSWDSRIGGWDKWLRLHQPDGKMGNDVQLLTMLPQYRLSAVPSGYAALKLSVQAAFSTYASKWYPQEGELLTSGVCALYVAIKCGEYYFAHNATTADEMYTWSKDRHLVPLFFAQAGEWRSEYTTYLFPAQWSSNTAQSPLDGDEEVIADTIPHGGPVSVELWATASQPSGVTRWRTCYIKELKLEVIPSTRAKAYTRNAPEVLYSAAAGYDNEAETVELPLRFGFPLGNMPMGTVVNGMEYGVTAGEAPNKSVSASLEFVDGYQRYTMLQRIAALGNIGDGLELELPLLDAHNIAITPLSTITSTAWQGRKVVQAFTRDIRESTIKVTVN